MNLLWLGIRTRWKMFAEYCDVVRKDYQNGAFRKVDLKLLSRYLFDSPFTISKQWAAEHGQRNLYTYGETPIPGLRKIAEECGITSDDHVFELGCGRGRACLWLRYMIGCDVTGIECVSEFMRRAKGLQDEKLSFTEGDFLKADLEGATVIYLNGTTLSRFHIQKLAEKLGKLGRGTKVITVSYPLTDYAPRDVFEVVKEFPVKFHWGTGSVYLQVVA